MCYFSPQFLIKIFRIIVCLSQSGGFMQHCTGTQTFFNLPAVISILGCGDEKAKRVPGICICAACSRCSFYLPGKRTGGINLRFSPDYLRQGSSSQPQPDNIRWYATVPLYPGSRGLPAGGPRAAERLHHLRHAYGQNRHSRGSLTSVHRSGK